MDTVKSSQCSCGNTNFTRYSLHPDTVEFVEGCYFLECANCYAVKKVSARKPKTLYYVVDLNSNRVEEFTTFYRATTKTLKAIYNHNEKHLNVVEACTGNRYIVCHNHYENTYYLVAL